MHAFKDAAGRRWKIDLSAAVRADVKRRFDVDLSPGADGTAKLGKSPRLIFDVLWGVVRLDAERRGVGEADFRASITAEVIDAASDALLSACVELYPRRCRKELRDAAGAAVANINR